MQDRNRNEEYSQLRARIDSGAVRIATVGSGYVGTVIAAVVADRGYDVTSIDIRESTIEQLNRGQTPINEPGLGELVRRTVEAGRLRGSTDLAVAAECDVIIVTVGTPLGPAFEPDTRALVTVSRGLGPHLREGQLVVLKSTVPPRTTQDVMLPILEQGAPGVRFALAFCPERLAEGRAIADSRSIPVVVGGVDRASADIAAYFWEKVLGVATIRTAGSVAAELVKLVDNLWIDLNVALANEVALLAERLGVDGLEVIEAANTLPKGQGMVNILAPSIGVGGSCLTKDPWFVHHLGKTLGLDLLTPVVSRTVNERMPDHSIRLIEGALQHRGRSLAQSKVAVLGLSFKNNTGDCRHTPTKPIIEWLEASGCVLEICDPWVSDDEARTVTARPLNTDLDAVLRDADCIAFLTGHEQFQQISISKLRRLARPGAVILDGRNSFSPEKIAEARAAGFAYHGIGR